MICCVSIISYKMQSIRIYSETQLKLKKQLFGIVSSLCWENCIYHIKNIWSMNIWEVTIWGCKHLWLLRQQI